MVIYLLLKGFYAILYSLIVVIPVFDSPAWFVAQLPDVLSIVASFNLYLPIYETVSVVIGLITFTLSYKLVKVVLSVANIDLNS